MYIYKSEAFWSWGNVPILHGTGLNALHHRFLMVFKLQHLLYCLHCLQNRDSYSTYMYLQSLGPGTAPNERGEQKLQPKWPRKAQYPGAGCSHQILMGAVTEAGPGSWLKIKVPSSATKLLWRIWALFCLIRRPFLRIARMGAFFVFLWNVALLLGFLMI